MNAAPFAGRKVHLMGIGGAGMSALVPLLQEVGAEVSGCDLSPSATVERLQLAGVPVALGHDPEHCQGIDVLVYTSAVPVDHEQIRMAHKLGIEVLSRPACLAELMRGTTTIAVAGSHGKSSTTWMLGHMLVANDQDPVVMVGGSLNALGHGGARLGNSGLFVAEVDESDGGFQHVEPTVAVITNLEAEHIRHYGSFAALCDAFADWLGSMGPEGVAVLPHAGLDPRVEKNFAGKIIRFGIEAGDVHATDVCYGAESTVATLVLDGQVGPQITVPTPGRHMLENALAAVAVARVVAPQVDVQTLGECERVRRRFTVHGHINGVRLVEDYAHHPTEITAALAAAKLAGGKIHALFQPHRYSRTQDLFKEFCGCFDDADTVVVIPVYAASEEPIPGVGGRDLAEGIADHRDQRLADHQHDQVQYAPHADEGFAFISARAQAGDTILVLGAGDVGQVCRQAMDRVEVL